MYGDGPGYGTLVLAFVICGGFICLYYAIQITISVCTRQLQVSKNSLFFGIICFVVYIPYFYFPSQYYDALINIEHILAVAFYPVAIFAIWRVGRKPLRKKG